VTSQGGTIEFRDGPWDKQTRHSDAEPAEEIEVPTSDGGPFTYVLVAETEEQDRVSRSLHLWSRRTVALAAGKHERDTRKTADEVMAVEAGPRIARRAETGEVSLPANHFGSKCLLPM
jgi:hypothetical protein